MKIEDLKSCLEMLYSTNGSGDFLEIANSDNLPAKDCILKQINNNGKYYSLEDNKLHTFIGETHRWKYSDMDLIPLENWKDLICKEAYYWWTFSIYDEIHPPVPYEKSHQISVENRLKDYFFFLEEKKVRESFYLRGVYEPQWSKGDMFRDIVLNSINKIYIFHWHADY